jgi:hypothetical protein
VASSLKPPAPLARRERAFRGIKDAAAMSLWLGIPPSVLAIVDEVIE